jgi:flagellar FliJ protein
MKRFRFSLQVVLDQRLRQEEDAQLNLFKTQEHLRKEEEKKAELEAQVADDLESRKTLQGQAVSGENYMQHLHYMQQLQQYIQFQKDKIKIALENVEKRQEELLRITQKRKALEILKEKELLEFKKNEKKEEEKRTDDFNQIRFFHSGE